MSPMETGIAETHHPHRLSQDDARAVSEHIRFQGRAFLRVSGKSMVPWIRPGDIVFMRRAAPDTIKKGDLVLFRRGTRLCLHRAIQVIPSQNGSEESRLIVTKGDAVESADNAVCASDILGTARFLYRREKEIDLNSAWRKGFARLLAVASTLSRHWFPIVCRMKHTFLPGVCISRDSVPMSHPGPSEK